MWIESVLSINIVAYQIQCVGWKLRWFINECIFEYQAKSVKKTKIHKKNIDHVDVICMYVSPITQSI